MTDARLDVSTAPDKESQKNMKIDMERTRRTKKNYTAPITTTTTNFNYDDRLTTTIHNMGNLVGTERTAEGD